MDWKILLADDDDALRRVIQFKLKQKGFDVIAAADGREALNKLKTEKCDLLLTDMKMPELSGLELLQEAKNILPDLKVILITAYADVSQAVQAIKLGAFDYITKPFEDDQLIATIEKALKFKKLEYENRQLKERLKKHEAKRKIIGISKPFKELMGLVNKIAPTDATILLTGESGTGKELIAREIHHSSHRSDHEFIAVNCAAIPKELIESELFGHVKGAFTGAIKNKKGKFEMAEAGTLFLDEIGELSMELQAKLLRAIQERVIEPVGAEFKKEIDVRLVAATNAELKERVEQGKFRDDLYYRLNVIPLKIPALRERKDDIPILVKEFLKKFAPDEQIRTDDRFIMQLMNYGWPGNIRELENLVERMVILRKNDLLTPNDLPADFGEYKYETEKQVRQTKDEPITFYEAEKNLITDALKRAGWNKSKAAKILNIARHVLIYRMKKHGITQPRHI